MVCNFFLMEIYLKKKKKLIHNVFCFVMFCSSVFCYVLQSFNITSPKVVSVLHIYICSVMLCSVRIVTTKANVSLDPGRLQMFTPKLLEISKDGSISLRFAIRQAFVLV